MSCRPARKTTSSGSGLPDLQRLFDGFFQSAERDLAERSRGIEVGRGLFDQTGPLGPEFAERIDAGIFDQSIGLDRDAADRLLVDADPGNKATVVDDVAAVAAVNDVLAAYAVNDLFWALTGLGDSRCDGRGKEEHRGRQNAEIATHGRKS